MARGKKVDMNIDIDTSVVDVVTPKESHSDIVKPDYEPRKKAQAICDMSLEDDEKRLLLEARVGRFIQQTQIPYIPALVTYKESNLSPPLYAIVKADHRFLQEAWDFYKTNCATPTSKDFLDIVAKYSKNPVDVLVRVVPINIL